MSIVLREIPQERALITVAILYRLFRGSGRSDIDLAEGMDRANDLLARDPDVRRDYEVLVRIFREAQARDVEWCADRVDRLCAAGVPAAIEQTLSASMLRHEAQRIRACQGEIEDSEWPMWIRSLREAAEVTEEEPAVCEWLS